MPSEHATLSPSSACRWLVCTPSLKLEQQFEDKGSDYAAEGTLAHALAELKARKYFCARMSKGDYTKELNKLKETKLYEGEELRDPKDYWSEMMSCTDEYLDYLKKITLSYPAMPGVTLEQRVDMTSYAPNCWGTADCIIIGGDMLNIVDFKYGKGVEVNAAENPQMKLYALGALTRYHMIYSIKKVVMHIFQPRINNISTFESTAEKLINWGIFTVRPAAEKAMKGEGEYIADEHCKFCKARFTCRKRAELNTAVADFKGLDLEKQIAPMPPLVTDQEIGDLLNKGRFLKDWLADLKEYALNAILQGKQIPGWKAVEGRSRRVFDDTDRAFEDLKQAGYDEAVLYERKPLTLSALEKAIGKKTFAEVVGSHIVTPQGNPTLVPESDKQPPFKLRDAKSDFKDINN